MTKSKENKTTEAELPKESTYSRDDLLSGAAGFGVSVDVMAGALKLAGKDRMTRAEAEKALERFKKREV